MNIPIGRIDVGAVAVLHVFNDHVCCLHLVCGTAPRLGCVISVFEAKRAGIGHINKNCNFFINMNISLTCRN